jgi:hypothetical protein
MENSMKPRKGQIVRIEFVDHVDGGSNLMHFVVFGRVAIVTKDAISIESWGYVSPKMRYDCNVNRHTIIRSAIKRIVRLTEVKE